MATVKYVSLDNLKLYDEKIKAKIAADDAEVLEQSKAYSDSLAENYEPAGAISTAKEELQGKIDAVDAKADANTTAVEKAQEEIDALELVVQQIQEDAYDDTEVRGLITGLENNKADKTQVASDIAAAVKTETDARVEAVSGVQDAIDTLAQAHATDKTALEGAIELKADKTALDEVSEVANAAVPKATYDAKVAELVAEDTRIAGLVESEVQRATKAEQDLEARIETMEVFWDTTEDADGVVNKLKEIQDYIAGDETGAAEMAGNIQKNTQDISAMDTAYKAADTTLQGNIDTLEGRVASLETASATHALKTEVEAVAGRATTLEGKVGTLETEMDSVESKATANETAISNLTTTVGTKASQEDLNGAVSRIEAVEAWQENMSEATEDDILDMFQ